MLIKFQDESLAGISGSYVFLVPPDLALILPKNKVV
jgi:hypothetical protein